MFENCLMNKTYKIIIIIKDNREYRILKVKNYLSRILHTIIIHVLYFQKLVKNFMNSMIVCK